MRVAGIGCRKGVAVGDVLAAVKAARAASAGARIEMFAPDAPAEEPSQRKVPRTDGQEVGRANGTAPLDALATFESKTREPAIIEAAKTLGLRLIPVKQEDLQRAAARCLTRSAASLAATGVPSLAEAAALAVVGEEGHLLGPRIATGNVTCAIAQDRDDT